MEAPLGPVAIYGTQMETRALVGLQWTFGANQPDIMIGLRRTETLSGNEVYGGQLDVAIPLTSNYDATFKPIVRLLGVAGDRDIQAEFGVGVRILDWKPAVAVGAQVPYFNMGTNYVFDEGFKPYAGLNTVGQSVAPKQQTVINSVSRTTPNAQNNSNSNNNPYNNILNHLIPINEYRFWKRPGANEYLPASLVPNNCGNRENRSPKTSKLIHK